MPREWILWAKCRLEPEQTTAWMQMITIYAPYGFSEDSEESCKSFLLFFARQVESFNEGSFEILPGDQRPKATKNCTVKEPK